METYQQLRAMRGRGVKAAARNLTFGQVIRVDSVKYRVVGAPEQRPTGSLAVEVYSEDNQFDTLYLSLSSTVRVIGEIA